MEKCLFEMGTTERQYHHIASIVEYAHCMISEGISGGYDMEIEDLLELQERIASDLLSAHTGIQKLLKSSS